jgi:hypothetical protein
MADQPNLMEMLAGLQKDLEGVKDSPELDELTNDIAGQLGGMLGAAGGAAGDAAESAGGFLSGIMNSLGLGGAGKGGEIDLGGLLDGFAKNPELQKQLNSLLDQLGAHPDIQKKIQDILNMLTAK